jgi:hypothetical protein
VLIPEDSKNNPEDQPERRTPKRLTNQQWAQLRNDRNFAAIFRALHPAWSVTIERTRPSWCTGWLETIECDPEDPIDQEYIRDTWGGQRFKLVVNDEMGQYVTSFRISIDGPPKRNGRVIDDPEDIARRQAREDRALEIQRLEISRSKEPAPSTDPTLGTIVAKLIEAQTNKGTGELDFVKEIMKQQLTKKPEERRDLKELMELATSMREMAELFGMNNGGEDGSSMAGIAAKFMDVLDRRNQLDARQQQAPQRQPKRLRVIKNPGAHAPQIAQGAAQGAAPPQGAAHPQQPEQLSRAALASTLAGMDPMDAAAVTMSALAEMPAENRIKLMEMLGGEDLGDFEDGEDLEDLEDLEENSQHETDQVNAGAVLEHETDEGSKAG